MLSMIAETEDVCKLTVWEIVLFFFVTVTIGGWEKRNVGLHVEVLGVVIVHVRDTNVC